MTIEHYIADGVMLPVPDDGVIRSDATELDCIDCPELVEIVAPQVTTLHCRQCPRLERIEPLRLPSSDEERTLVHTIADRVAASPAALDMSAWHKCETTHCLGGWAQVESGEMADETAEDAGRRLVPCLQHLFFADDALARSELFRIAEASGWKRKDE